MPREKKQSRYIALLEWVFNKHYVEGATSVPWVREELIEGATALGIDIPKNLGDVVYSVRYRTPLPESIVAKAPEGMEWIIRAAGRSKYTFDLIPAQVRIRPNPMLEVIKIPDATPEIIRNTALGDEQALLALVRYNRLLDVFLGVTAYSLQNHLRTTARGVGQVEVDEIYVAVDSHGRQFILPVQAKGGTDELGITQTEQDVAVCAEKWPDLICRPISVQFAADGKIAMFELTIQDEQVVVRRESQYQLVGSDAISASDLARYRDTAPMP